MMDDPQFAAPVPATFTQSEEMLRLADYAKLVYERRRERQKAFPVDIFGEPAWDILLDLYVMSVAGKAVSISDACIASCSPNTTALRAIANLERGALIIKQADARDRRKTHLILTEKGAKALQQTLEDMMRAPE